jgi:hypothetical protein
MISCPRRLTLFGGFLPARSTGPADIQDSSFGSAVQLDDSSGDFLIPEVFDEVIVHHSHCVHMGVNDTGTYEAESTVFRGLAVLSL